MLQTGRPLPAPVLYPLLKALDPARVSKSQFKAPKGARLDVAKKRDLLATLDAAQRARSARQFEKLRDAGATESVASRGAITTLTVEQIANGYTKVEVIFEDGTHIISVFPTT